MFSPVKVLLLSTVLPDELNYRQPRILAKTPDNIIFLLFFLSFTPMNCHLSAVLPLSRIEYRICEFFIPDNSARRILGPSQ